ncbi:DNA cytosine methyltransferase [Listeria seeligeri]|uniref:DNA cytosine methyltransferase n=1 Tax=Listeria seeligeri TaxID=1640 RepID=UPI0016296963|nr:DNA cytosine methyltransferase [Listeria seeligeri]MBC1442761.1 DNA cytosine methyltransferase [Listeria seeligeri]MBC1540947.1 DNA cytosine methyltransferase [Listeria seeligeri]MBC1582437.1 DNA cytosine methyltransferase [Listeria seeligeri]MBC1772354.1 DNA cytosine methyltransferase [Listeria seeligeri]MBC1865561.1 DNA cytosine methyltransferase [Listeria seeligeri]
MNYIDLFAGCGGLSLGLHNAGIQGLFAVEKNEDAFATLKYNLIDKKKHFLWPDWLEMTNWDIDELIKRHKSNLIELRGSVDLIVGGPPCQGFSMAGKRKSDDLRNRLVNAYIEFVKLVKPTALFFENVHGFTVAFDSNNKDNIPYSLKLINELKILGYNVDSTVINMSEYGVPQKRKRFILFASKKGNAQDFFINLQQNKTDFLHKKGINIPVTVNQAISDLRRKNGELDSSDTKGFKNGKYSRKNSNYQKIMRKDLKRGSIPDSHRFAKHKKETEKIFIDLMAVDKRSFRITPTMNLVADLKKRGITPLKKSSVCPTITSIPDDFIHYSEPRIMTVREHARIQSFPDDFHFKGKYTTGGVRRKIDVPRYTQVANAVPPLFAEQVGLSISNFLQ